MLGLVPRNSESCDGKQCLGYQKDLNALGQPDSQVDPLLDLVKSTMQLT